MVDHPLLGMYFVNRYRMGARELIKLGEAIGIHLFYDVLKMVDGSYPYASVYTRDISDYSVEDYHEMAIDKKIRVISFLYKLEDELGNREIDPDDITLKFKIAPGSYLYIRMIDIDESIKGIFEEVAKKAGFDVGTKKLEFAD